MITRTIKTSTIEYTTYNKETDDIQVHVTDLVGTYDDEESLFKALKIETASFEIILKAKVVEVTTQKYSMPIYQFIATAVKSNE